MTSFKVFMKELAVRRRNCKCLRLPTTESISPCLSSNSPGIYNNTLNKIEGNKLNPEAFCGCQPIRSNLPIYLNDELINLVIHVGDYFFKFVDPSTKGNMTYTASVSKKLSNIPE